MGRGIAGRRIFRKEEDREDFLSRLGELCRQGSLTTYAWALMENHLLVRTGRQSLSQSMRRLLTGYVINFNRRHKRPDHLFQNRYKSIICEDDPYLLELTRYIHLNPIRAGVFQNMVALAKYLWEGHSVLVVGRMGIRTGAEVARFLGLTTSAAARTAYSEELPELQKYL
jgi:REP element-mobilizing transposase RayT